MSEQIDQGQAEIRQRDLIAAAMRGGVATAFAGPGVVYATDHIGTQRPVPHQVLSVNPGSMPAVSMNCYHQPKPLAKFLEARIAELAEGIRGASVNATEVFNIETISAWSDEIVQRIAELKAPRLKPIAESSIKPQPDATFCGLGMLTGDGRKPTSGLGTEPPKHGFSECRKCRGAFRPIYGDGLSAGFTDEMVYCTQCIRAQVIVGPPSITLSKTKTTASP